MLTRLVLVDFRSYAAAELQPGPGLTVIAGPNGAGKTNLLEAVYVAVAGRSHRAATDADLVRHGAPFARVRLELAGDAAAAGPGPTVELVLPGTDAPAEVRKRLTVNGVARRAASLAETVRAVLFRPEEMLLLVGSPGERRRFLDGILTQRDRRAARDLAELARVLAQRNALLRAIRAEEADPGLLAFWDDQLAAVAARVTAARIAAVTELDRRIGPLLAALAPADGAGSAGAGVRLHYADSLKDAWPARAPSRAASREASPGALIGELEVAYRRRLADVRQKELWNGVSLVGPQREDLRVELAGREVATHASRGQQRTIILALKLAETELLGADGPRPIVLLDDAFSELDTQRSEAVVDLLLRGGQVIVTTADLGAVPGHRRRGVPSWLVSEGRLLPAPRVA
jgi:DNA replication and repair protein RecF